MSENKLILEVLTMVGSGIAGLIAGVWAMGKAALNARNELDERIDRLEKNSVSRPEMQKVVKEIRDESKEELRRIYDKIDGINNNILLLIQNSEKK